MDEFDWSIGDIPESKDMFKKKTSAAPVTTSIATKKLALPLPKQPSTIASRRAASALSMTAKRSGIAQPIPKTTGPAGTKAPARGFLLPKRRPLAPVTQPTLPAERRVPAVAASRSTVGYNKGRSVSSAVYGTSNDSVARPPQNQMGPKPRAFVRSVSTASTSSEATITPARFAQSSKEVIKKPEFMSIFDADADEDEDNLGGGPPPMDGDDDDFQLTVKFE
jgi:hypothetical protein